jgi:hypothetical protein
MYRPLPRAASLRLETNPAPPSSPPCAGSPLLFRQLEYLSSDHLDRLVEGWLNSLGFRSVRLWERRGTISTYEARFGADPISIPARVRVHQRLRRLEIPHVESFLGHLVRSGSPVGILVTPGECSWGAGLAARTPRLPFLRLCGGAEWSDELASARREKEGEATDRKPGERGPLPRPAFTLETRGRTADHCAKGEWRGGYRLW